MTTTQKFGIFLNLTGIQIKPGTAGVLFNRLKGYWEVTADVGTDCRKYAKVWDAETADAAVEIKRLINA